MLQVVYLDVAKIHLDVAIRIKMFHLFQIYVANIFIYILHIFHVYVASACFKYFNCFRRVLHLFYVEYFMF
jgi:hypothetical protein